MGAKQNEDEPVKKEKEEKEDGSERASKEGSRTYAANPRHQQAGGSRGAPLTPPVTLSHDRGNEESPQQPQVGWQDDEEVDPKVPTQVHKKAQGNLGKQDER